MLAIVLAKTVELGQKNLNDLGHHKMLGSKSVTMTPGTCFKVAFILLYYQSCNQAVQRICTGIHPQFLTRLRMRLSGQHNSHVGEIYQAERRPVPWAHCLFHHWLIKKLHQHARSYLPANKAILTLLL